jgi:hypothetical protein
MLVYVRPSNEALLRARVPGAQDQCGCSSIFLSWGGSASKKDGLAAPLFPSETARCRSQGQPWPRLPFFFRSKLALFTSIPIGLYTPGSMDLATTP